MIINMVSLKPNNPKFLFCENLDGSRYFVFHTEKPKFLVEFIETGEGYEQSEGVTFFDKPPENASQIARLMREAGDFLVEYDTNLGIN